MITRNELDRLLVEEIEGCHAEAERRAVAEYVRDCLSDADQDDEVDFAARVCEYLSDAALVLAAEIRGAARSDP